jgi:hypothetical protein
MHARATLRLILPLPGLGLTFRTAQHSPPDVGYPRRRRIQAHSLTGCPIDRLNLTELVDHELELGPLDLNLADLQWPAGIQNQLDKLNGLLLAIFIFYVLGIGFSGLAILLCIAAFFLAIRKTVTLSNFAVAFLAALALVIGSIITTVGAKEGAKTINDFGKDVGVSASPGMKFITISWVAFAMMAAATLYWMVEFCLDRRARKRVFTEKHRKSEI